MFDQHITDEERKQLYTWLTGMWRTWTQFLPPSALPVARQLMRKVLKAEDKEFNEFVELMQLDNTAIANKKLQEAAAEIGISRHDIEEKDPESNLLQCHYCGDMYNVAELSAAQMGLICYKCQHEMENQD
jgi:uncharacterized protein (DUF1778 family)